MSGSNKHTKNDTTVEKFEIVLRRYIQVHRYPILATITVQRERDDLVKLLNFMKRSANDVPPRLKQYVEKEGLWKNHACTELGEKVLSSKTMCVKEKGLYYVWYSVDDPLLGTRPLFIERDAPHKSPNIKKNLSPQQARASVFRLEDTSTEIHFVERKSSTEKVEKLLISSIDPEVIGEPDNQTILSLTWKINATESNIVVDGSFGYMSKTNNNSQNNQKQHVYTQTFNLGEEHWNTLVSSIAEQYVGTWNQKEQRIQIAYNNLEKIFLSLEQISKAHSINHFIWTKIPCNKIDLPNIGEYSVVNITNVPIMPHTHEAELWQKDWLVEYYKNTYRTKAESMKAQAKWLDHVAIQGANLCMLSVDEMLRICREKRADAPFWHISAMEYLNPSDLKLKREAFTLIKGEFSIDDFWKRLGNLGNNEKIKGVLYSDRYATNPKSPKNLENFKRIIEYCPNIQIQIHSLNPLHDLLTGWKHCILPSKTEDNHPRYWVVWTSENIWYWSCDHSLTFIERVQEYLSVKGVTTFTPLLENRIPNFLKDAVTQFTKME